MPGQMWVRVRDRETKHEYDVLEGDKRIGVLVDLVKSKRYPPSARARPTKHYLNLAGRSATRSRPTLPRVGKANPEEN